MTTIIEGGFVVGFDGENHRLIKDGVVVFDEDRVVHVGKSYSGRVDEKIDAKGKLVTPGFINTHCHCGSSVYELFALDVGRPDFAGSIMTELGGKGTPHMEMKSAGQMEENLEFAKYAMVDLLLHGSTTIVEVGSEEVEEKDLIDLAGKMGVRIYTGPQFTSGVWYLEEDGSFGGYEWDEEAGLSGLEKAKEFVERYEGAYEGRVKAMLFPIRVDTTSPNLYRETRAAADELGVGIQSHTAQSQLEFVECLRRYKKTPIEFLAECGILGPDFIAGHCWAVSEHPLINYPWSDDLALLSKSGSSVAHCPLVLARRGGFLKSLSRYAKAGVNVTIGTDTYPRDIVSEMRYASYVNKIVDRDFLAGTARDVFYAATLNGAKALSRDDLGILAPEAQADIVITNLKKLHIYPVRDPIKSLINAATGRDVETVIIAGRKVVENGSIQGFDEQKLIEKQLQLAEKEWLDLPRYDWAKRNLDEFSPQSIKPL